MATPKAFGAVTAPVSPSDAPDYDCWNTIGVAGNGSCRELLRLVHCRNCPVYSDAALQLLERPSSADDRREWTERYAQEKKITTPARTSVVIFRVVSEWLALPTQAFQEVAESRALHPLPHRRGGTVLGLVNVRGELLVCVSLGRLLGFESNAERGTRKAENCVPRSAFRVPRCLLVANWDGDRVAFLVDEVSGVHRVPRQELRDPPATVAKSMHTFSRGVFAWRDRTVGFLDADALFSALNRSLA